MYYCGNCGSPVSGVGRCSHCGAYLSAESSGSVNGMNAARDSYNRMERINEEIKLKEEKRYEVLRKYGYKPVIGFAPTVVMAFVSLAGLVLSFTSSMLFLIMYGVALLILVILFLFHTFDETNLSNKEKNYGTLYSEALWIIRCAYILPILCYIGTRLYGTVSNPDIVIVVSLVTAFLLHCALRYIAYSHPE